MPSWSDFLPTLGLGIPSGPIQNSAGETVFPTNALERFLAGSAGPTNQFAAAFMGPARMPPISGPMRPVLDPNPHLAMIPELEAKMAEYAQGKVASSDVQKLFKSRGWSINLRGNQGIVPAYDPAGNEHMLQF